MKIRSLTLSFALVSIVSVLALAVPMFAHHGTGASYAMDKKVTLKGTVTEFRLMNPHCQLYFDVKDEKGNVVHWLAELSSPATMLAAGMSKNTLKLGDEIVIKGKVGLEGAPFALVDSITKDGKAIVGDPNAEGRFINNTR